MRISDWSSDVCSSDLIDQFIAEDSASRTYTGKRLHEDIESVASKWKESVQAPARQAKRLQENNLKLMKLVAATAKTGLGYKGKLAESATKLKKSTNLVEQLTKRGQGWMDLAESRKAKLQPLRHHFDTACESLDIMAER